MKSLIQILLKKFPGMNFEWVKECNEKQIEKIKRESKGIQAIESKLKTWDYTEVMEMHDCLERSNEIINNLGLVPDSFI